MLALTCVILLCVCVCEGEFLRERGRESRQQKEVEEYACFSVVYLNFTIA